MAFASPIRQQDHSIPIYGKGSFPNHTVSKLEALDQQNNTKLEA